MPRYWGFWTREKLDVLRRYLDGFTTASTGSPERIYLDVFGGQPENRDRLTEELLEGSARLALQTDSPPFTKLRFFELEPHASELRQKLESDYPDRDFKVYSGNSNEQIHAALEELRPFNWAPTFAFVDPNGPDAHWTLLEALARFKKAGKPKVEMWLLLPAGMSQRMLPTTSGKEVSDDDAQRLNNAYGTEQWRFIYEARRANRIDGVRARTEYVNLMRWRLENVLGYKYTHEMDVKNERGSSIYHMIFASDHPAGNRIMTSLYNSALNEFPAMLQEVKALRRAQEEQESGIQRMFDVEPVAVELEKYKYQHVPPWLPYGTQTESGG